MEIELGGPNVSETSLDNINPTMNELTEQSETQSGVYRKVRAADSIEKAHASLGMSFDTTPNTSTATEPESPLTKFCRQIQYEVVDSDDAGAVDKSHQGRLHCQRNKKIHLSRPDSRGLRRHSPTPERPTPYRDRIFQSRRKYPNREPTP